jgi:F-type H+-transporting ATPase subunit b
MNLNATLLGQAITFFILVVFTWKFVWPPLVKAIEERQEKIRLGLVSAEQGEKLLKDVKEQASKIERDAYQKSKQLIDDAEKRAVLYLEEQKALAQLEAKKIVAAAEKEVDTRIQQLRDEVRRELAELVVLSASGVVGKEVNAANHGEFLKTVGQKTL